MAQTATVRARVRPDLKQNAETILEELGLSATTVIRMLYEQIVMRHAVPFSVSTPNAVTRDAMRDAAEGRNLTRASSADELIAQLDSGD